MAEENVQLVRKAFDAFVRRDVDAAVQVTAPDVEFSAPATESLARRARSYRGHDGIRQYFADVASVWEALEVFLHEYHDLGDQVLVVGRARARGRSGFLVDEPAHWAWRIEDGKIVWGRVFTDRSEALAAVGLEAEPA
jgi:ketosteroid isomerase-like protein